MHAHVHVHSRICVCVPPTCLLRTSHVPTAYLLRTSGAPPTHLLRTSCAPPAYLQVENLEARLLLHKAEALSQLRPTHPAATDKERLAEAAQQLEAAQEGMHMHMCMRVCVCVRVRVRVRVRVCAHTLRTAHCSLRTTYHLLLASTCVRACVRTYLPTSGGGGEHGYAARRAASGRAATARAA